MNPIYEDNLLTTTFEFALQVPITGSDDVEEATIDEIQTTKIIYDEDDADNGLSAAAADDENDLPPPEGDDEEALEARRLYYARKVTGGRDLYRGEADEEYVPLREACIDEFGRSYGTGKRKTSIARVWIKDGSGLFVINDRRLIDYFPPIQREDCLGSFVASKTSGLFDVWCTVKGGGISGRNISSFLLPLSFLFFCLLSLLLSPSICPAFSHSRFNLITQI